MPLLMKDFGQKDLLLLQNETITRHIHNIFLLFAHFLNFLNEKSVSGINLCALPALLLLLKRRQTDYRSICIMKAFDWHFEA